jgi:dienelactone hydrolase
LDICIIGPFNINASINQLMKKLLTVCFVLTIVFQFACNSSSSDLSSDPKAPDASKAILEEITFRSNGETLEGSIVFPPEKDIVAGVVFVHGAGKEMRDLDLAKKFAREGIAILVYDKRGAGVSGGEYMEGNNEKVIKLLADDAASAIELLSNHSKLKDKPIGLVGFSQAGWIIPLVAAKSKDVKFVGLWSGPLAKLSEVDMYSMYTSERDFKDVPSLEEMLSTMKRTPYRWVEKGEDMDPSENLGKLNVPGLWIFSKNDGSIPVDHSIVRLDHLIKDGAKYDYVIFTGKGHDLVHETTSTMTGWIKRINDPATLVPWIKQAKDSAAIDNSKPVNSDNLVKFTGTYKRKNQPMTIIISEKDNKLKAVTSGRSADLRQIDDDSFYFNYVGAGYVFFDFDLEKGRLLIEQLDDAYSLDKVK